MRPVIGALPLLASIVLASVPVTLASFSATTSSPNNAFTNLVVQPATLATPVTAAAGAVRLSWTASATPGATYAVLRSPSGFGLWAQVATLAGLSYSDTPPADGQWDYEVQAVVASFTATSNLATGLSDRTAPTAATSVTAATGTATGTVSLTWTSASDGGSGVAGYTIRFVQATTCPAAGPANYPQSTSVGPVTSATVGGLTSAKKYCFYLFTSDAAGNTSGASNVASAKAK